MRRNLLKLLALLPAGLTVTGPVFGQQNMDFCQSGYILGDIDEDGLLTLREVETMRTNEFGALDSNADGIVTLEEFRSCLTERAQAGLPVRNVSATGSGDLGSSGVRVELEALTDGTLDRTAYMEAAEHAYDATGNQEDTQLEWARAFILLLPAEETIEVETLSREEYAARAAALFDRLDSDADGKLTPEEWTGEGTGDRAAGAEAAFQQLDRDGSGDVTQDEYAAAGAERAQAAREAATAAGWEDHGDYAAGIGSDEAGDVVSTSSEGLVTEGDETAATAQALAPSSEAAGDETAAARNEGDAAAPAQDTVPVFFYYFHDQS